MERRLKHILAATDFSDRAEVAIQRCIMLARKHNVDCTFIHVVDSDSPSEYSAAIVESARKNLRARLSASGLADPDILIVEGTAYDQIMKAAEKFNSDLIIVGAHRKNILLDFFKGTTVDRLLRVTERPVLIAREMARSDYHSIVIGLEMDPATERAIEAASELGFLDAPEIAAVHTYRNPEKDQLIYAGIESELVREHVGRTYNRILSYASHFIERTTLTDKPTRLILEESDPVDAVLRIATEAKADLIIVGTRGLTGIRKALLGGVADGIIRAAHCDVLAVPPDKHPATS